MIFIQNPLPCNDGRPTSMIHAKIPKEDYEYLRRVFPGHGNIQAVTLTLISQLIGQLKADGIERYEFDNEAAIRAILERRGASEAADAEAGP